MLRPSRKHCRIVVAPKHLTVHLGNDVKTMPLTNDASNPAKLMSEIAALLLAYQPQLKHAPVQVVLANYYVRYSTLDWRQGIHKSKDWHAVAENQLRQLYGQKAALLSWEVTSQGYGRPLLIAATDKVIVEQFEQLAKLQAWQLKSIQPAFISVVNYFASKLNKQDWLMMFEPQRLLLAQAENGCWKHFSVAMPPKGEEVSQAKNMLSQARQSHTGSENNQVVFYGNDAMAFALTAGGVELVSLQAPASANFQQDLGYGYL